MERQQKEHEQTETHQSEEEIEFVQSKEHAEDELEIEERPRQGSADE